MSEESFLEYLLSTHKITQEQANHCREESIFGGHKFEQILVEKGYLTSKQLNQYTFEFEAMAFIEKPEIPTNSPVTQLETGSVLNNKTMPMVSTSPEKTKMFEEETTQETPSRPQVQILPSLEVPLMRYDVLQLLGEGGMGLVEKVQDHLLQRVVARKKIKYSSAKPNILSKREHMMILRLKREGQITAVLEHPNIVPLYDMQIESSGDISFTMRKVEGKTLRAVLNEFKEENTFDENKILSIYFKVCDAIAYSHSRNIIHRDLKPDNIMVGQFGEVYVMDWGIAKVINEKELFLDSFSDKNNPLQTIGGIGTPGYMSPEQSHNAAKVTSQSDIYALGKILRECFVLLSPAEEFQKEVNRLNSDSSKKYEDVEEQIPQEIRAIIKKATEEEAKNRYEKVQDLALDLERYQKNMTISVKEYSLLELARKWLQRHKQKVISLLFVIILLLSIFLYNWIQRKHQSLQNFQRAQQVLFEANHESNDEKKIKKLLEGLDLLNTSISLHSGNREVQEVKWKVGKESIALACNTQNYQLAEYIASDLKNLSSFYQEEGKLEAEITVAKTKLLKEHQKKLGDWKKALQQDKIEARMRDNAIFEISKMQEPQIFDALVQIVEEGGNYYFANKERSTRKDEYYCTMTIALARMNNKAAGPLLINILEKMETAITNQKKISDAEMNYMLTLAEALAILQVSEFAPRLQIIRWSSGQNSPFWTRTESIYQDLLQEFQFQENSSNDPHFYLDRGLAKQHKGDLEGAILDFSEAIKLDPQFSNAYSNRGNSKKRKGDFEGAILDHDEAIKFDPQNTYAYTNRGLAKYDKKDFNGAILDFNEAIKLDPNLSGAYSNRGLAKQGKGDFDGAILDYNEAIKLNPQDSISYNNRGNSKESKRDFEGALLDFMQAIKLDPKYSPAYMSLGNLKQSKGDIDGAILNYNEAIKFNPQDSNIYNSRGLAKESKGDFDGAILDYNEAIKLNDKYTLAYSNRGLAKQAKGDIDGAIRDFNEAIKINPRYEVAYYNRGVIRCDILGEYDRAIEDFNQVISLDPNSDSAYFCIGIANLKKNNLSGVIDAWIKAIDLNPRHPNLSSDLANLLSIRSIERYRKKEFLLAQEDLLRFKKYATTNHPKQNNMEKLEKLLEAELKKQDGK